ALHADFHEAAGIGELGDALAYGLAARGVMARDALFPAQGIAARAPRVDLVDDLFPAHQFRSWRCGWLFLTRRWGDKRNGRAEACRGALRLLDGVDPRGVVAGHGAPGGLGQLAEGRFHDVLLRMRPGGVAVRIVRGPHHVAHADVVDVPQAEVVLLVGGEHLPLPVEARHFLGAVVLHALVVIA